MNQKKFSVEGKVAIVTGGGTGVGAGIAREFAANGAAVLIASRKAENLEKVRDQIRKEGGACEFQICDVRAPAAVDEMIAAAVRHFGRLDVLINNHGASLKIPSLQLSPNAWKAIVAVNLDGVFFCSCAAARQFIEQKTGGSIINISSEASLTGFAIYPPYAAAKAGVNNLTKTHSAEWAQYGIRVNCLILGPIETPAWELLLDEETKRRMAATRALKRLGTPEEIAYPCIFLASDASSYITGAVIEVCGGVDTNP
ncbi:MAG TPA: glucose 1-dehydrogenase [Candidatus Binataceae bacterium]|nr:glucose 1-dehydrogenase [Candidatus Binataceae bacterium]